MGRLPPRCQGKGDPSFSLVESGAPSSSLADKDDSSSSFIDVGSLSVRR